VSPSAPTSEGTPPSEGTPKDKLPSLGVKCTDSRCEEKLHCFKPTSKMTDAERGHCRSCGADLVEWERVHQRDPADADYLVGVLKLELVRHEMWRVEIPESVRDRAVNPKRFTLDEMLMGNLRRSIGISCQGPAPPARQRHRPASSAA
jgi:hypothetical protein